MIGTRTMMSIRELWEINSFRARVLFAIVPTLCAAAFGYFATDRTRPYDYIQDESFILPSSGSGGDQVTVVWKVVQHRNKDACSGIIERQIVDPDTAVLLATYDPVLMANNGPVNGFVRVTFALPRALQPGWVGYQSKLTFTCNWLQALFPSFAIRYTTPRLLFKVEG